MTEVLLTRKLLEAMAEFDDPRRARPTKRGEREGSWLSPESITIHSHSERLNQRRSSCRTSVIHGSSGC